MNLLHAGRIFFQLCILLIATEIKSQSLSSFPKFEKSADIGNVKLKGLLYFNTKNQEYTISASGKNIWGTSDEFHFAYREFSGNFILQGRAAFQGEGIDPHRKTGWMFRKSLDTSSAMVSVAIHGDGLVSLQYRTKDGDEVREIKSPVTNADIIQLERRGQKFIMSVAKFGDLYTNTEVDISELPDAGYAGMFVCSHNPDVIEIASFINVRIIKPAKENFRPYADYIGSHIEELDMATGQRRIIHSEGRSLQAPNYINKGKELLYNSEGLIHILNPAGRKTRTLNTGTVKANNNDHVISFDGKMLGLSSSSGEQEYGSLVYTVPLKGGIPKRITAVGPSYLHGFSPDGKWLTYTGGRNGNYDIYKIRNTGGEEIRLTNSPALDDGSEYSPDGKYIYFNSARTGMMQIWRMKADGSDQEQITSDGLNDWFPHISPDGKWLIFLSYLPDVKADDHPFYKNVYFRLLPVNSKEPPRVIAYLYGGQGSINTGSWNPKSNKIAFVSNSDEIK